MERVERRLLTFLRDQRSRWSTVDQRGTVPIDVITDLVAAGGKRIRPACCVTGFLAAGGDPRDDTIVDMAAALEMLHACALLHDDIMDESPLRRGKPTAHISQAERHRAARWLGDPVRYGENIALLAGDLALVYADLLMRRVPPAVRDIWNDLRVELIIGQFFDTHAAAVSTVDPELARWIAVCKSGRYTIERPLVLGATLAGTSASGPSSTGGELAAVVAGFTAFGLALGEAFQLRDDLIDVLGDAKITGKPTGQDFAAGKMTLLLTTALRRDDRLASTLGAGQLRGDQGAGLLDLVTTSGALEEVERRIAALVERARSAVAAAPISQAWREDLSELATQIAYRER
jgi:geranylgeranyl diphosphate synthase type I